MTTLILAQKKKKSSPLPGNPGTTTPYPTSKANQNHEDGWSPDGQVFIHYGKGYTVAPNLATVCIGPVNADGKPLEDVFKPPGYISDTAPEPPDNSPAQKKGVAKLQDMETVGVNDSQIQNGGSFATSKTKHPGGRPKKEGAVHRTTAWRRQKAQVEQGVLL